MIKRIALKEGVGWLKATIIPYKTKDISGEGGILYKKILSGEPFAAGKIGTAECYALRTYEFHYEDRREDAFRQLCNTAEFFPLDREEENRWAEVFLGSLGSVDYLIEWNSKRQRYFVDKYCKKKVMHCRWISSLEKTDGKRL